MKRIDKSAFSGQKGITGLKFAGNQLEALPDSVFRDSGISGAVTIPSSVQTMGNNLFNGTKISTLYLPKRADDTNNQFVSATIFGVSYDNVKAIICDKADYKAVYAMLQSKPQLAKKLGYEMTVSFVGDSQTAFEPIKRLYNHALNFEKGADGVWAAGSYKLPEVEGKCWGLEATDITPVDETSLVTQDKLYLITAYENPVITYGPNVDKVYDGQPSALTVTAEHPLAKKIDEAGEGDVVFYYTWSWETIGASENVLVGFDEATYEFSDVREPDYAISCLVKVQTCIVRNKKAVPFHTEKHAFSVWMRQAEAAVNPVYPEGMLNIADGMPQISLSEGDSEGTIAWEPGQTLTEGINDYTWIFTPAKNAADDYNYKAAKGSVQLHGVNGKVYQISTESGGHGSILPDKPFEAVSGSDITVNLKPEAGYKLASVFLDNTDVTADVSNDTYELKAVQSDHTIRAEFAKLTGEDAESLIEELPKLPAEGNITEAQKDSVLHVMEHYSAMDAQAKADISDASKEAMYEAVSKLPQIELNVDNKIGLKSALPLLENIDGEDVRLLKDEPAASVKLDLIVGDVQPGADEHPLIQEALEGGKLAESYDISVIKTVISGSSIQQKNLQKLNAPIKLVFKVPEKLLNTDESFERSFYIIHLHTENGKQTVSILEDEHKEDPSTITVSSDAFSLYAIAYKDTKKQPAEVRVTVTFESLGGSIVEAVSVKQGQKLAEPAAPKRDGYTFTGWYKDKACTLKWDFANDTANANITLYAGWQRAKDPDDTKPPKPEPPKSDPQKTESPKTGDDTHKEAAQAALAASLLSIGAILAAKKRR